MDILKAFATVSKKEKPKSRYGPLSEGGTALSSYSIKCYKAETQPENSAVPHQEPPLRGCHNENRGPL